MSVSIPSPEPRQVIFNFTGNGSVRDNSAAVALSNAFSMQEVDDVSTRTGFYPRCRGRHHRHFDGPGPTPPAATTTKAPLTAVSAVAAIVVASLAAMKTRRK